MATFWLLDSNVWGVIIVNKRLCILTQWATKTHDGTVFGISWRQTGTLVLLSKTKGLTIKISKYCAGCFSMNINHLIFVHHIVLSISQYPYICWFLHLAVIYWNLGSRLKSRKSLDGQSEMVFVDYCSEPRWTEGKYSQYILFWNAKEQWGTDFCSFTIFLYICNRDQRPEAVLHGGAKTRLSSSGSQ